jgi:HD-GYP domain-containing protein (c-di-GMP phosphodiesterase class II)
MGDTQVLLSKIAALRKQLEEVQSFAQDSGSPAAAKEGDGGRIRRLEQRVATGCQETVLLDQALRQLTPAAPASEFAVLPKQLTARARRLLQQGRVLLDQLRSLADDFAALPSADPLSCRYHETAAMAETALRMVQAFPDAPSAQLRLCEGLEAILAVVAERVAGLTEGMAERRQETAQIQTLAEALAALQADHSADIQSVVDLAEALVAEAQQAAPLRFLHADPEPPARFIACHSLTVAQVMARVVRHDPELGGRPLEAVLAGLLHDAGMLAMPVEILTQPRPLDDEQRRVIETHCRLGAEILLRVVPTAAWLAEAAAGHHERLDGTGYPAGLRERQIQPLARLLAVCDVYAALCSPRPFRSALGTRTAMAETLLLAEQGLLDRCYAERLLQLSFYPVGSVVELADGAVGVVVATHLGRRDLNTPARPVLALLTDVQRQILPTPRHVDLAECDNRSIVRTLAAAERHEVLGRRYPELV